MCPKTSGLSKSVDLSGGKGMEISLPKTREWRSRVGEAMPHRRIDELKENTKLRVMSTRPLIHWKRLQRIIPNIPVTPGCPSRIG